MSKPILFYSKNNHRCVNLWNKLTKDGTLNHFIKVCVDNNNKIPAMVTTVPSIFIKGRPLICNSAIPMYLNSISSVSSQPQQVNNPSANQPQTQNNNQLQQNQTTEGINDFNPVEMSHRWSDSYSFITENPEPLSFNFQFLNQENNTPSGNQQPNPVPQIPQGRKKEGDFQDRLEKLQQSRIEFK